MEHLSETLFSLRLYSLKPNSRMLALVLMTFLFLSETSGLDNQVLATSNPLSLCQDGFPDQPTFSNDIGGVENVDYLYVLTDAGGLIIQQIANGIFDFDPLGDNSYQVWGVSFTGTVPSINAGTAISDLDALPLVDLSINFISVQLFLPEPPSLILSSDISVCGLQDFDLIAQEPENGTGTWSIQSGPISGIFDNVNSPDVNFQVFESGLYILVWETGNEACGFSSDQISISVDEPGDASAGSDLTICTNTVDLQALEPSTGIGIWNLIAGPNTPLFDPNDESTTVSNLIPGNYSFEWIVSNGACSGNDASRDTVDLLVQSAPTIGVSPSPVTTLGGLDGSATICITGGELPFSYNLIPNIGNINPAGGPCFENLLISDLAVGDYTFSILDANGCESNSVLFTIDDVDCSDFQIESVGFTNENCPDDNDGTLSIELSGGVGPYTFAIGNGIPNQIQNDPTFAFTGLSAGTYVAQAFDSQNCNSILTTPITISEPPNIILSATVTPITTLGAMDGTISLCINGGTNPFVVNLDPNLGNGQNLGPVTCDENWLFTNLPEGNYLINVEDGFNCQKSILVNIPNVNCNFQITALIPQDLTCPANMDGNIQIVVTGGQGPYEYQIIGAAGSQSSGQTVASSFTFNNLDEGSYTVQVTNGQGCSAIQNDVVLDAPPGVNLNIQTIDPTVVNASNGSICLSPNGGLAPYTVTADCGQVSESPGPCGGNFSIIGLSQGSCTINVLDANGCSTSETVTLTDPDCSGFSIDNLVFDNPDCAGLEDGRLQFEINGTPPFSYSIDGGQNFISTNETEIIIENLPEGTYNILAIDQSGCSGSLADNPVILEDPNPIIPVIEVNNQPCFGTESGSLSLNISGGTPPYVVNWSTGSSAFELGNLPEGDYDVNVMDQNSCEQITTIQLESLPEIELDAGPDQSIVFGESTNLQATTNLTDDFQVLWSPQDGLSDPGILNPVASPGDDILYTLTVSSSDGCIQLDSLRISVEQLSGTIVIPTAFSPNNDGRNDRLQIIEVGGASLVNIQIFNRWGQQVYIGSELNAWDGSSNGEEQGMGTYQYVVQFMDVQGTIRRKGGEVVLIR